MKIFRTKKINSDQEEASIMKKSLFVLCCILAMLMAGCGGSSSTPASTAGVNGVFSDAPVVGLPYSCGGTTGVTGAGGTFNCPTGSTVTFSVGGITLCTGPAQPFMTPVSCAQITNPSANTATPSVVAVAQFLQSISTTPASSGALTITASEVQAAASETLNFSTATPTQLQTAVSAINPGATLVTATAAQNELMSTVNTAFAGNYSGTFSGSDSGTWTATFTSAGSVSGTATSSINGDVWNLSGNFVSGTTFNGTAVSAPNSTSWTGTLDTSKTPAVFSGPWTSASIPGVSGTFTGTMR